jgi:hypothetical protein
MARTSAGAGTSFAGDGLKPVAARDPSGCSGAKCTVVEPFSAASAAGDGKLWLPARDEKRRHLHCSMAKVHAKN